MSIVVGADLPAAAKSPLVLVADPLQPAAQPAPAQPAPAQPVVNGNQGAGPTVAAAPAAEAPATSPASAPAKRAYPAPADMPTQQGPKASCSISTMAAASCCRKPSIPGACD